MNFFENLFEVLFWVVAFFSPIVLIIGLWKLYDWHLDRQLAKQQRFILGEYKCYQARELLADFKENLDD